MAEIKMLKIQKVRTKEWEGGCSERPEATSFASKQKPPQKSACRGLVGGTWTSSQ